MGSQKAHQAGCALSLHPGGGVEPGEFTSPGGGGDAIPRLVKWLRETFYEVDKIMLIILSENDKIYKQHRQHLDRHLI